MNLDVTFREQSAAWLRDLATRKRKPVAPATLRTFGAYVRRLTPFIGEMKLIEITNGTLKQLVQQVHDENLSAKTINELIVVVKSVVGSLVDQDTGEPLVKREWLASFIDAPVVENQRRPRITGNDVQRCIDNACTDQEKLFYAVLAGSGLRVAEAQALHFRGNQKQTSWDPERGAIRVRSSIFSCRELHRVKTAAARRKVDPHPLLNDLIARFVEIHGIQPGEHLFQARGGRPIHIGTIRRRLAKHGIPGCHCFRRFYVSLRRSLGFPEPLLRSMIGHSGKSITDDYDQSAEDEAYRKKWVEKVGLGFTLPTLSGHPAPSPDSSPRVASAPHAVSASTKPIDCSEPATRTYSAVDTDLADFFYSTPEQKEMEA